MGGLLGSSSPCFLVSQFSVATLWDGKCCMLYRSCISGLLLWSSSGGVSGKDVPFGMDGLPIH